MRIGGALRGWSVINVYKTRNTAAKSEEISDNEAVF